MTSGRYWSALAATAERGLLDFLTFDDTLIRSSAVARDRPAPAGRPGRRGLVAARIAPVTRHIGLIPVATVTHTEPFHVSKAIATLDFVSHGRAGWQAAGQRNPARGGAVRPARHTPTSTTCSTRPPTPSKWSGDCGTAGRTTPSSATLPPGDTSTGTSCTTSTSSESTSPSRARRSLRVRRRASPSSPRSPTPRGSTNSPPAAPTSSSSPRTDDDSLRSILGEIVAGRRRGSQGLCRRVGGVQRRHRLPARTRWYSAAAQRELVDLLLRWQQLRHRRRPAAAGRQRHRSARHRRRGGAAAAGRRPLPHRLQRRRDAARRRLGLPVADNRYARVEPS